MSLETYLRAAPKAELHVHLEGAIRSQTLLTLAQRNGVPLPATTVEALQQWFTFRDFAHFVEIYVTITNCLKTAADYELIAYEFGAEMARQNTRYAEVTFTPATHKLRYGIPHDVYFAGLTRGRERAHADFGVELSWVFDMVHFAEDDTLNQASGDYTAAVAIEGMDDGVVALGLGGPEIGSGFERIAPYFERAKAAGLHSAPHAGETRGPESVWGALRMLGAERIGHGVRAIEDPALVAYLAERRIPLEVCPTSNLRLGVYPNLASHPFRVLHDAGVPVTLNSDDPPLFNTTLDDEVALMGGPFGLSATQCDEVLLGGVYYSFLPEQRKREMEAAFRAELATLKEQHLGA